MTNLTTSAAMRWMIEQWEGRVLHTYRDVVGVPTIGFGHTGPDVTPGLVITPAQADALLAADLRKFEISVNALCGSAPTTQAQFDAMVSFAYNLGAGNLHHVAQLHRAGDYAGAAALMLEYDHAGGQVLEALLRRRQGEAAVYLHGAYTVPATVPTPPVQAAAPAAPPASRASPAPKPAAPRPIAAPSPDDGEAEAEALNAAELAQLNGKDSQ